jgi:radical SAM superfamily enzyme YgiQ (UPF0313 family)
LNIALIDASGQITGYGVRLIASLLKRAGHSVRTVFIRSKLSEDERELQPLTSILKDVGLVLISVYSYRAFEAVKVTEFVHRRYPGMKVIWGGPHCIAAPQWSLQYADGVCFSEGDQAVVELVDKIATGKNYLNTKSMAFYQNGSYTANTPYPPYSDLEKLPHPDYDLNTQYLLDSDLRVLSTKDLLRFAPRWATGQPTFWILSMRGCPHRCSYCNNACYNSLYGSNPLRFRSADHVLAELKTICDRFDFFRYVAFGDDDFFLRPTRDIERLAQEYQRHIKLPFYILGSVAAFNRKKMQILLDAGLKIIDMGIQSGSQRVLDRVFDRDMSVASARKVIECLRPYQQVYGLFILLDFIIDNPYETEHDIVQTYRLLCRLPSNRVHINLLKLSFFPGTPLYRRALADGFIEPFQEKTFRKFGRGSLVFQKNYMTFLLFFIRTLHRRGIFRFLPKFMLHALASFPLRFLASILPELTWVYLGRKLEHR